MNSYDLEGIQQERLVSHLEGRVVALEQRLRHAAGIATTLEAACKVALAAQLHPNSIVAVRLKAALKMAEKL